MTAPTTRVLLVDDDDVNLMTFGLLLEERGYVVTSARTLVEARALSAKERFHVAVLDVHVGKERSPTIVPSLLADNPGIRVVFLSGSLRSEELLPGADLILAKADDPETLLAAIDRVVGRGP